MSTAATYAVTSTHGTLALPGLARWFRKNRWMAAVTRCACGVALLLAAGCRDQGPSTGNVRVTVTTTGGDLDLDGHALTVHAAGQQSLAVTAPWLLPGLT